VIIEGFKSYKDQTVLEPFSNKINCVGKSAERQEAC
jgi:chromosome segregation ATPase